MITISRQFWPFIVSFNSNNLPEPSEWRQKEEVPAIVWDDGQALDEGGEDDGVLDVLRHTVLHVQVQTRVKKNTWGKLLNWWMN